MAYKRFVSSPEEARDLGFCTAQEVADVLSISEGVSVPVAFVQTVLRELQEKQLNAPAPVENIEVAGVQVPCDAIRTLKDPKRDVYTTGYIHPSALDAMQKLVGKLQAFVKPDANDYPDVEKLVEELSGGAGHHYVSSAIPSVLLSCMLNEDKRKEFTGLPKDFSTLMLDEQGHLHATWKDPQKTLDNIEAHWHYRGFQTIRDLIFNASPLKETFFNHASDAGGLELSYPVSGDVSRTVKIPVKDFKMRWNLDSSGTEGQQIILYFATGKGVEGTLRSANDWRAKARREASPSYGKKKPTKAEQLAQPVTKPADLAEKCGISHSAAEAVLNQLIAPHERDALNIVYYDEESNRVGFSLPAKYIKPDSKGIRGILPEGLDVVREAFNGPEGQESGKKRQL